MRAETEAAIRAAGIAQRIANSRVGAERLTSKGGIDLVTATDVACEDAIRADLSRAFPKFPIIGEERGGTVVPGTPYWLVDPICGTRPFASNIPLYCTNIALVEDGIVTTAAIAIGATAEIVYAEKTRGAWVRTPTDEQPLSVSADNHTIWIDGRAERTAAVVQNALLLKRWYVWLFSSSVAYAYLASGRIAGILHFGLPSTNHHGSVHTAAGCFVAAEAGAIVTDLDTGKDWDLRTRSYLVAADRAIHDELRGLAGA
jgi:myo-inositol-1(or 4)-monophosphatase